MALLRNLRGIFTEINKREDAVLILDELKKGVPKGKQFPFRYWSAYNANKNSDIHNKQLVLDALEECIDIAVANMPKIPGKVACLSDNSGSAWGSFNSEYGTVTVAEIANLSSLITAQSSDEGYVGVFGDRLSLQGVSKRNGLLTQLSETSKRGKMQGGGTVRTWDIPPEAERLYYYVRTNGRPLKAVVELVSRCLVDVWLMLCCGRSDFCCVCHFFTGACG
jgi:hypothetical protein